VAGKPELSLLIQRIHLPLEEEEHMPPKNKLQLTEEELEILSLWVSSGGRFDQKVMDLPQEDPLFVSKYPIADCIATNPSIRFPLYQFQYLHRQNLQWKKQLHVLFSPL
jgi:hypothetical protein